MKIILDVQKIKGNYTQKDDIRVMFQIDDDITIYSQYSKQSHGVYSFMEKHTLNINIDKINYVQVAILNKAGIILAQITVFENKFKEFNSIEISNEGNSFTLLYKLYKFVQNKQVQVEEESDTNEDDVGVTEYTREKPEFHKLVKLVYNTLLRLDILVYSFEILQAIILWKKPYQTLMVAIILTIFIYNLKTMIFLAGLALYFYKETLITKISTLHKYRNNHTSLRYPQKNAMFLQVNMDRFNSFYDVIAEKMFFHDKRIMINSIKLLCKAGMFLVIFMIVFGIEHCIVIGIWSIFILTSPFKNIVMKHCKPITLFLLGEYFKVLDIIEEGIFRTIGKSSRRICDNNEKIRQFYYYQYERWWLFKGWNDQQKKYSDDEYEGALELREKAPSKWGWIEEWKLDFNADVDSDGYQYSSDLVHQFTSRENIFTVLRRRRWKRQCIKLREKTVYQ